MGTDEETADGRRSMTTSLVPVEDEGFGYHAVVPSEWTKQAPGVYTRATPTGDPDDYTLLLLQSVPLSAAAHRALGVPT